MKTGREKQSGLSKKLMIAAMCLTLTSLPLSTQAQREERTINDSWKFLQGENSEAVAGTNFDDTGWQNIHLPHTWNEDAYTVKNYYRGKGWYRRSLRLPESWKEKQIFLKLDAASKAATVYINGQKIGEHAGGYTAFTFDITPYLNEQENTLAVCVDNSREDICPISGDFTFFGGIYRDVWLTAVPKQHFNLTNLGSSGIFITTPQVSEEQGTIAIRGEVKNDADRKATLELTHTIYAPDGTLVQTKKQKLQLKAGETLAFNAESSPISAPQLWTPETPHLYRIESVLSDRKSKAILDRTEHYTGFRWFHFDGQKGFFLNGKPYKLRGMCRHQDQKPIGVALTDEMHRRDFMLMKEMGVNFIRISHYPQDDALLEMCDKLGMLAWEEIPIIDIVPETEGYGDNCERNLREMIRQHYNHPSIITWGYMNEILLVTQRRYRGEALKPVLERTLALANRLEQALKEEDPTRVSTMAFHGSNDYNKVGLGSITDIVGWNLYSGWYGGDLKGFDRFLEEQQHDYPTHPLIVSEYGAGSDRRLHSLQPQAFDFCIEYQQRYLEHYVPVIEQLPYVCGGTHWNFIDFSSAVRDESMPRINNKGLVYANRTPKDVYHYYKAAWRTDIPVLYIASRDWTHRTAIEGTALPVKVYSNLPEVELFVDGRSLGKKQTENFHTTFYVTFTGKEPFVHAKGIWQGQAVEDGLKLHFTAIPATLTSDNLRNLELAINVGSNCFFTSDESHLTWLPDQAYTPGSWGYVGGKKQSTQTEISNTADGPLFQTMRSELEGYRFDVPAGTYEIELLFTDIFRPQQQAAYLLGKGEQESDQPQGNRFAVCINGQTVEDAFSPGMDSGYFRAVKRRYLVESKEGENLIINFLTKDGKTFLSGIKLRKL